MKSHSMILKKQGGFIFIIAALLLATVVAWDMGGCSRSNREHFPPLLMPTEIAKIVSALAINPAVPDTLYAGTNKGVYKSTDGGGNWLPVNTGLPGDLPISDLVIDPLTNTTLYAGSEWGGVYKSMDGGGNWAPVNAGPAFNIHALAIDPAVPTTLYAGTAGGGIFKSTDGGGSWRAINTGLPDMTMTGVPALAIDPAAPATLYAGTGVGAFKSTDGGESWEPINTGLTNSCVKSLAIDPSATATLYAGAYMLVSASGNPFIPGSGIFKSTNGGKNWEAINKGLTHTAVSALAIDPSAPATLYAGTWGSPLFKTTNGGRDWMVIVTGQTGYNFNDIVINPFAPDILYVGTFKGVFKSTDGGESWKPASTGLPETILE